MAGYPAQGGSAEPHQASHSSAIDDTLNHRGKAGLRDGDSNDDRKVDTDPDRIGEQDDQRSSDVERTPGSGVAPEGPEELKPLHRKLKSRHLVMISIGGIIGPGLLVGGGNALATAGPAGALIAFAVTGIIIFNVMQSLGELATLYPVTGSFTTYASKFVDDSLAFGLGWVYWELWISVLANEYNSVSIVLRFWAGAQVVPQWAWILIFWIVFMAFSFLGVLAYGEVEFWLSTIKVLALCVFFILSIVINTGGSGNLGYTGFKYWGNPGAFADGVGGVAKIFVVAGTLYAGCEMVGVAAGESANPTKAVPKAIRSVFYRILIFYIGTIFFIGINIPYNDDQLLSAGSKASASPLTIALQRGGINAAASVINAVIIVSVISAGNSSLYVASRTLCFMAREGRAPSILGRTTRSGVPIYALVLSNAIALISLLNVSSGSGKVFTYLINISGVSSFLVWAIICLCHIRFRAAMKVQGRSLAEVPFKALLFPWGAYFGLAANIFLVFFQGYTTLFPFSAVDWVVAYIVLPVFVTLVMGWKIWHRTKIVPLAEVDLDTGKRIVGPGAQGPALTAPTADNSSASTPREREDAETKANQADVEGLPWTLSSEERPAAVAEEDGKEARTQRPLWRRVAGVLTKVVA